MLSKLARNAYFQGSCVFCAKNCFIKNSSKTYAGSKEKWGLYGTRLLIHKNQLSLKLNEKIYM